MSDPIRYASRPHAAQYMGGTFYPAWRKGAPPATLSARWQGYRAPARDVEDFARLCGMPAQPRRLPPLFVHATSFRLQMALLAHRSFPVPIWRVLQVRNQLMDRVPIAADAPLDFECRLHAHRALPKGLEVDLHTRIHVGGTVVAESLNTFYVRGFRGTAGGHEPAAPPPTPTERIAGWRMSPGESWRFGSLTGDYNPVHMWSPYARMMGFRGAFFHPLRVVGHSLARAGLQELGSARRVGVWMRGPVYHGAAVELRRGMTDAGTDLALFADGDPRPALVMRVSACDGRERIASSFVAAAEPPWARAEVRA
jgi:acyl dehydratase